MSNQDISIDYGNQTLSHFIPDGRGNVRVIESTEVISNITSIEETLIGVLENPVNCLPLKELVNQHYPGSGNKVLVIADDNTRPNIHTKILHPLLLKYLIEICGVDKSDLKILVASGTHRPPTDQEIIDRILGEDVFLEYRDNLLIHNDQDNLADLGLSKSGTPITINQAAIDACLIIPITDSEYHYFAGVAGTVKQLFPGIAGRITTNTNHTRMFDTELGFTPACRLGNTDENPVISDMKEMAEIIQKYTPVFCIDAILDRGEITLVNAGDIISLHEKAQEILFHRRVIKVDQPADLVIISVGKIGINLYQAGKGIHAAWNAAKQPGGTILLLAPCEDGAGTVGYQETMEAVQDLELDEALAWVIANKCDQDTFRIGNQKPVDTLRILKTLGENNIKILCEMNPDELRQVYRMDPLPEQESPQETLRAYLDHFLSEKPDAVIYIMKDAGLYVIPENSESID
ncbi:MAG: lactate racemase domain-containing protein [Anaerolineales bacterium]|nr:lactate racemase domain-containing protein [Anaerolineales bacterium]